MRVHGVHCICTPEREQKIGGLIQRGKLYTRAHHGEIEVKFYRKNYWAGESWSG